MPEKHIPITGGCLCGEVRYEITESPIDGGCCHCDQCKRAWGGFFSAMLKFNKPAFKLSNGELKYYYLSLARRGFCINCGAGIVFMFDEDNIWVALGTLDHPGDWPFDTKGWYGHDRVEEKVSWYEIRDGLIQNQGSTENHDDSKMCKDKD